MTLFLAIALGVSTILLGQIELTRGIENSVIALYAADTGIERTLYAIRKQGYSPTVGGNPCLLGCPTLLNQASYSIEIESISPDVEIDSRGSYGGVNRAIEITY